MIASCVLLLCGLGRPYNLHQKEKEEKRVNALLRTEKKFAVRWSDEKGKGFQMEKVACSSVAPMLL
jgi:hypothetical protein